MKHIFRCTACGQYTLLETCPKCNSLATNPKPAKFSPQDKYAKYRRMARKEEEAKTK